MPLIIYLYNLSIVACYYSIEHFNMIELDIPGYLVAGFASCKQQYESSIIQNDFFALIYSMNIRLQVTTTNLIGI